MQFFGLDAVIRIICHMMFIYVSFWAMQSIRIEQFFRAHQTSQVRLLIVLFSIVIGYTVSSFFLEFLALCRNLFIVFFP
ncbi:hypothetical protein BCR24_02120 [Enterococcus ureilyticus]|uniref:DUF1146 domain-containing protein n=1 Tax=Enterococcus ureilyticus TaxID=1131292 RepID=A0A1E5HCU6_9ENTE|nr:DUF1146 family protein [Enterococcus ureilyticus]MBM7687844.1 putative integral membrane protein (TIGR02327 family) [Enterococcus ureilyticus]MBO0447041.1 DUF1146 domain-containing protein [Enterococcus ureilyticus]OEG22656.1 hypothetical protein BCR24_02120 [Enterococcus ureilyticus]